MSALASSYNAASKKKARSQVSQASQASQLSQPLLIWSLIESPFLKKPASQLSQASHVQALWLPVVFAVDFQGVFVAGDVADHGVGSDAGEDCRGGAQGDAAQLAVPYLEDERRDRSGFAVNGGSDAAKIWQISQVLPEFFIFGEMGEGACIILEITHQAAGQVLPTVKVAAPLLFEDEIEQVTPFTFLHLFLHLEEY